MTPTRATACMGSGMTAARMCLAAFCTAGCRYRGVLCIFGKSPWVAGSSGLQRPPVTIRRRSPPRRPSPLINSLVTVFSRQNFTLTLPPKNNSGNNPSLVPNFSPQSRLADLPPYISTFLRAGTASLIYIPTNWEIVVPARDTLNNDPHNACVNVCPPPSGGRPAANGSRAVVFIWTRWG